MVIVGSGAIGVEFAYFYNSMGVDVTVIEYMPNIIPGLKIQIFQNNFKGLLKSLNKYSTKTSVEDVDISGKECKVTIKNSKGEEVIDTDIVLSAVGVVANNEDIGLGEKVSKQIMVKL